MSEKFTFSVLCVACSNAEPIQRGNKGGKGFVQKLFNAFRVTQESMLRCLETL